MLGVEDQFKRKTGCNGKVYSFWRCGINLTRYWSMSLFWYWPYVENQISNTIKTLAISSHYMEPVWKYVVLSNRRKGGIITIVPALLSLKRTSSGSSVFRKSSRPEQVKLETLKNARISWKICCILITPELYGSDAFFISQFRKISD